ncbi:MAG TPA: phage tail protein [Companilactobacillus farciminis]|uniref:Phage tail protein n=1 Tax=Companilactobacillus farciminis TaxID=1612 RepID=A0A921LCM1_9LACO|nr:phage tail protein [Companilactobacillus farciminis]
MALPPIILDTDKTTPIYELPLKIRQGDTGDELQVTLGKSFQKYTDLSTVDVELIAKTPDQRLIKQAVTDKSGNTFKVKFPDEMYTNVGVFRNMYFKIGDDSTSSVKLVVLQGIGSIKEAGSYIDDFETLIEEAESYVLALKDFSDTGNAKIDNKVAELTGKMQSFVDQAQKDLNAAKEAWSTFQSSSQTAFTDAQDKRASDFNSQRSGFETDFSKQKTDFENRFKALLTTLQSDYDDFKALINKDVADFNTSLDSLDAQATDVKNKYDALKAQLDSAAQNVTGVRTNLLLNSNFSSGLDHWTINTGTNSDGKAMVTTDSDGDTCIHITGTGDANGIYCLPVPFNQNQVTTSSVMAKGIGTINCIGFKYKSQSNFGTISTESYSKIGSTTQGATGSKNFVIYFNPVNGVVDVYIKFAKLEKGPTATDYSLNPLEIATDGSVQTAITNALDKADYSTAAEVDKKIATGVGQAKTYAEQSIKDIIGAAPATLDTIGELADAVTKNKDGVQAINEGITKKADKTEVTALQNTVQTMITSISQADYDKLVSAGTVDPKIMYVIPDA